MRGSGYCSKRKPDKFNQGLDSYLHIPHRGEKHMMTKSTVIAAIVFSLVIGAGGAFAQNPPPAADQAAGLRVLARRPVAFYLILQGRFPIVLLAGPEDLKTPRPAPGWSIVDETVADAETRRVLSRPGAAVAFEAVLDPITLLDVAPEAAFGDSTRRRATIWVVAGGALPAHVPAGRSDARSSVP